MDNESYFVVFWHMQLYMFWYIRSFYGFTFLNILYFFKYYCTNIFQRRSLYTFYSIEAAHGVVLHPQSGHNYSNEHTNKAASGLVLLPRFRPKLCIQISAFDKYPRSGQDHHWRGRWLDSLFGSQTKVVNLKVNVWPRPGELDMAESYITIGAAGGLAPPGSRHYQSNDHTIRTAGGLALVGLCQVLLIHKADVIVLYLILYLKWAISGLAPTHIFIGYMQPLQSARGLAPVDNLFFPKHCQWPGTDTLDIHYALLLRWTYGLTPTGSILFSPMRCQWPSTYTSRILCNTMWSLHGLAPTENLLFSLNVESVFWRSQAYTHIPNC